MIDQSVSHYRILERLGRGGMGVVYKAQDMKLDRSIALKFLPPDLTLDPDAKQRFVHEAKTASALQHNNICVVHDIDESPDGQMFIVMEYYAGETLKKKIERGPVKLDQALDIGLQIAQGLAQAHKYGIVHRDIKPANVMVTDDGVAKIVDFGLAKLSGMTRLTKTGSTVGTVGYMSPEQLRGEDADLRGDVFSFGVLLYEMLTGHLPFRGNHAAALTYAIANEPPIPLQSYIPDVGSELVHIIHRALEKDPNERYQNMMDLLIDLGRLRKETTGIASGTFLKRGTRFFEKKWIMVIASTLVLVSVAVILFVVPQQGTMPRLNPKATTRHIQLSVSDLLYCALSPDGNWIAFGASDANGKWDIYFMNSNGGDVRRVTQGSTDFVSARAVSPDGAWILFVRGEYTSEICLVPSMGGETQVVCRGIMPKFASNGERIIYLKGFSGALTESGEAEVWSVNRDGTDNHIVRAYPAPAQDFFWETHSLSLWPSPDGKSIAFVTTDRDLSQNIMIYDIESRAETQMTLSSDGINELFWTQNNFIIFSQYTKRSGNFDLWMCSPEGGEPLQLTRSPSIDEAFGTLSASGSRLLYYQAQISGNLRVLNLETGVVSDVTSDDLERFGACMSPDNRYVAFSPVPSLNLYSTRWGIQVVDREGERPPTHLVSDETVWPMGTSKSWSPDGKYIAYVRLPRRVDEKYYVCIVSPSGQKRPQIIAEIQVESLYAPRLRWLDERTLCWFNRMRTWTSSIENPNPAPFYQDSTDAYSVQDGRYVFFRDYRQGREGWWIDRSLSPSEAGRTSVQKLLGPVSGGLIAPGGQFMLYMSTSGEPMKLLLPEGKSKPLPYTHRADLWESISQDGKSVVYIEHVSNSKLMMMEDPFIWE